MASMETANPVSLALLEYPVCEQALYVIPRVVDELGVNLVIYRYRLPRWLLRSLPGFLDGLADSFVETIPGDDTRQRAVGQAHRGNRRCR